MLHQYLALPLSIDQIRPLQVGPAQLPSAPVRRYGLASLGRSRDGDGVGQLGHAKGNVLVGHVDLWVGVEAVAVHLALDLQMRQLSRIPTRTVRTSKTVMVHSDCRRIQMSLLIIHQA